jgi:hypothetical protein
MAHHKQGRYVIAGGRREIHGATGTIWVEYKKGVFVPKNSLAAYQAAKARRESSQAYLHELSVHGVRLPHLS